MHHVHLSPSQIWEMLETMENNKLRNANNTSVMLISWTKIFY